MLMQAIYLYILCLSLICGDSVNRKLSYCSGGWVGSCSLPQCSYLLIELHFKGLPTQLAITPIRKASLYEGRNERYA